MRELMDRCLAGDNSAWKEFLAKCQPKIAVAARRRALWYTNSPSLDFVDDIVADVVLKLCFDDYSVLRRIRDLPDSADHVVFGYLKRMAANLVTDRHRGDPVLKVELEEIDEPSDHKQQQVIEEKIQVRELFNTLREKISPEPTCDRDIAIFQYNYQGFTAPEIARMLGMKVKAVENVIGRCRGILREGNRGDPQGANR
jgi:RNA polymerase sigma factor (sigma-70 family)